MALAGLVVAVVAVVVSVVALALDRPKAPLSEDLAVTSVSVDDGVTTFLVPASTSFADLPDLDVGSSGCTPAQRKWMSKVGTERQPSVTYEVRNTALSGPMLTLTRIIPSSGEEPAPQEQAPTILVDCPSAGSVDHVFGYLDLDLTAPTTVGLDPGESQGIVGLNLEPGETAYLTIRLDGDRPFAGTLDGTLLAGDASETVDLSTHGGNEEIEWPGAPSVSDLSVSLGGVGDGLANCQLGEEYRGCTPSFIDAVVALELDGRTGAERVLESLLSRRDCELDSDAREFAQLLLALELHGPSAGVAPGAYLDFLPPIAADCSPDFARAATAEVATDEMSQRAVAAVVNPPAPQDETERTVAEVRTLLGRAGCDDAVALAQDLGELVAEPLGGNWVAAPGFDQLIGDPVAAISTDCGLEFAASVVNNLGVVGQTNRALMAAAEGVD